MFYNDVSAVYVCFDLTDDDEAFSKLDYWLTDLDNHAPSDAVRMLCGLKLDLVQQTDLRRSSAQMRRQVSQEKIYNFTKKHKMTYIEISSKTGENV